MPLFSTCGYRMMVPDGGRVVWYGITGITTTTLICLILLVATTPLTILPSERKLVIELDERDTLWRPRANFVCLSVCSSLGTQQKSAAIKHKSKVLFLRVNCKWALKAWGKLPYAKLQMDILFSFSSHWRWKWQISNKQAGKQGAHPWWQ